MEREKLFTIGQFAKLHHLNKKTLMWYDEIGLFRPALTRNKYRYYTYRQSQTLETIRILRELDMSIAEIKDFLDHRSEEAYLSLLRRKMEDVDQKIAGLQSIRETLVSQEAVFAELLHTDLTRIEQVEREEEYLYVLESAEDASFEEDVETILDALDQYSFQNLHDVTYGALISVDHLRRSEFEKYSGLFMKAPGADYPRKVQTGSREVHLKPRGTYLRAYCRGAWDRLPGRYREILQYADEHGLCLTGYSYETGINEIAISSPEEYITQMEILLAPAG